LGKSIAGLRKIFTADIKKIYGHPSIKKMTMPSSFSNHAAKALLAFTFCTFGLAGFMICAGQGIVGKWKGVSAKVYYSADYAKQVGKSMEEKTAKETGNATVEYKADHSFVMTFSALGDAQVTTMNGTWKLSGDQLTFTMEPKFNPRKTSTTATIVFQGNNLVLTAVIPPPSKIIKTISTCTKM
jgi:hypothetical protein